MNQQNTYRLSFLFLITLLTCGVINVHAQVSPQNFEYPHNHLPWFTIQSNHFLIHFQEGSEEIARVSAAIADDVYEPITELYQFKPENKISIVLRDREDYANGAAFFFDDKIEIWIPPLDTPLRGTHDWLENVIAHEFTHMIQLGASMKRSKNIPAIYLQWLAYEDVRRPDVLYGFPRGIITHPFSTVAIPAWFAEGAAQFQKKGWERDFWDSHRDMILRSALLGDNHHTFHEMGVFTSKNSLERELIYNMGFAFTAHLAGQFGEDVLMQLSQKAADGSHSNFSRVIESVLGKSGEELFNEWISLKRSGYVAQLGQKEITRTVTVEKKGFFNFYPQWSSDGERFAYLSNRGRDSGNTSLIINDNGEIMELENQSRESNFTQGEQYQISHGFSSNASLDLISSRFSFSPDGSKIIFSKREKNRYGEFYNDLYLYDIANRKSKQLTFDKRLQDPAWSESADIIAAIQLKNGTQNLVIIDPETASIETLTDFQDRETIFSPIWHPGREIIYFSAAKGTSRNLYSYDLSTARMHTILEDRFVDFRDPWVDSVGKYLYFSADPNGIFNIYRLNLTNHQMEKMTEVHGGAFMPFVHEGELYFSGYGPDGYKIAKTELKNAHFELNPAWQSDESQLTSINERSVDEDTAEKFSIEPYQETSTGLAVYPVVRFDNYTQLNGGNGALIRSGKFGSLTQNLWRDLKVGAYFSIRDVTENLAIFAGALMGPGSRLADSFSGYFSPARINHLDRDLFLIADYRGLPFIKRSWSPTLSIELYNMKRNVKNGLEIEEFACTSCLPQSRFIDTRYSIWEANLFLRSKINRWNLLELGVSYSPYTVSSDGFFSEEYREFIPGSTSEYFKGTTLSATWYTEAIKPTRHSDIAPEGVKASLGYKYQPGRLLDRFEVEDGTLSPAYNQTQNHSLELISALGFPLMGQSTGLITSRAFAYLNSPEDYFYLDYNGGLSGLRSYPFFAVGGQRTAFLRTSFITPLIQEIYTQIGPYTLDKLYAHLYAETGNGWGGPLDIGNQLKSGIGAELRFAFNNAYLFPMKFFLNTSYGLNRFEVTLPSEFVTTSESNRIRYGNELLFYFGLTFDFDVL
ncbi:TolB-like translocation protein [Rhodohalobacter halophilus]|uniref:PD40 domain-containing protein n=1 Tax=Rhodohalobacter halophilus TaxID=1812810 RepID=UPI00083F6714|nr:PD40 domain-containing protein [Rhodohalobacter halophilus]